MRKIREEDIQKPPMSILFCEGVFQFCINPWMRPSDLNCRPAFGLLWFCSLRHCRTLLQRSLRASLGTGKESRITQRELILPDGSYLSEHFIKVAPRRSQRPESMLLIWAMIDMGGCFPPWHAHTHWTIGSVCGYFHCIEHKPPLANLTDIYAWVSVCVEQCSLLTP